MQELIEFYSIFGSLNIELTPDNGLLVNVKKVYIDNYDSIKDTFIFSHDKNTQSLIEKVLYRLSIGDRKRFSIYKKEDISQPKGKQIYKILYDLDIIYEEESRESSFKKIGQKNIKKHLRGYKIENKIHFRDEATRFWFRFIAPNVQLIKNSNFDKISQIIKKHIEEHISLTYELLCLELIKKEFSGNGITSSGSYWSKNSEIDILVKTENKEVIVGESKWKNSKICKSVFNSLKTKAKFANLHPTRYALFSKSGFSNEVLGLNDDSLLLYELKDFKGLLNG